MFFLCMEVLGKHIQQAVSKGQWRGISVARNNLKISHLFLANDLLLFGEVSVRQEKVIYEILQTFYVELGQKVNQSKFRL